MIGSEPMQVADGKRLFHITLPAALFAQPRANPPQGRRQREIVGDNLRRLLMVARGDSRDEAGDVQPGGASGPAGADAVAGVVGEQQFQRGLARCSHFVRIVNHYHSLRRGRGAGGPKVGPPFDLHRAQEAGSGRLKALDVAERRDAKAEGARRARMVVPGATEMRRPSMVSFTVVIAARNPKTEDPKSEGRSEGRNPKAEKAGAWVHHRLLPPNCAEDEV